jgi:superfamily II RNA helicase
MTDVYEGSLIRMFRRLEELLRQMAQASKVMGSEELEKKFEEALTKVKRGRYQIPSSEGARLTPCPDIVAAASLYL